MCHLFLCGQVNSSYAFQIRGRISQFGGQLRDHAGIEVVEAYGFVNPKHINNPTPENLEAVRDRNRMLIAHIKNSFWYRVSYSVFCIQIKKLISLSETRFFTGQTLLPLVTIALILTIICGSHLILYYHLTHIPRSCAQSTNGVQVSR